jgi:PAS domain S-box-containing protein
MVEEARPSNSPVEPLAHDPLTLDAVVSAPLGERPFPAAQAARLLREAARQLGESLDPERVYDHFHELVAGVLHHNGIVVSSYDERDRTIRCEYAWVDGRKLDPATLPPLELNPKGEGMQSRVILSGKGLLVNDVAERVERSEGTFYDVDGDGNVRKVPDTGSVSTQAALMAPVKHEGRVVGVVQLMSEQVTYTPEQLELMEGIVAQMSAAVRNARLYRAAQEELEARSRAETALRESEARFRAIFDSAAVGIAEVALDGRWLRVNDRLCEITGYTAEDLLQLRFQDITEPEDLALDRAQGRRMLAGEIDRYALEKRYRRKDGSEVLVGVTVSMVRDADGDPVRYTSVVEDITARRRAEEERQRLIAAEEAARAIAREREQEARVLSAVGDGIALVDHEGIVRVWNPAAERVTGLRSKQVVGRRIDEMLPGWSAIGGRSARGPEPSRPETMPLEVGGKELWLSIVAVQSADGVVYAFRDLTAQRRLDEAKTELVATVSHELRTPLSAVYGAAKTLVYRDREIDPQERVTLLKMIEDQTLRLSQLADEFLLASRLESGELPVTSERVDVVELVGEALDAMRSRLPDRTTFELRSNDALPPARGDPEKLRQVLFNLLDNAIKYSPDGGVVTVSVASRARRVHVAVRDHGLGIPRSEQQRVFEKFYRVDPHLVHGAGGTGLGLYISRELVERMDGRIGLVSEEGEGSMFFVELPQADV